MPPSPPNPAPSIEERHQIEAAFHDKVARDSTGDFYDFGALDIPDAYLHSQLGDLRGKRIVEIGCGDGRNTIAFAAAGAEVIALDISSEMVAVTRERADAAGLSDRISARRCSIEELDLPDASCDIVYGHSVLHHLDLERAIPRIASVLKSGGRAAFLDPLDHNPVLNMMRKLTPNIRTPTEKPLSLRDIAQISSHFSTTQTREFHFLGLAAFFWYYAVRNERIFRFWISGLAKVDEKLFAAIPFSRRFSWVTILTFIK